MDPNMLSAKIAQELSAVWELYKTGKLLRYLESTFGIKEEQSPTFRCIYIAETEAGDMIAGPSGGLIKHFWQVDDKGIDEIRVPQMDWADSPFYATPRILFYIDGDRVAINELYGPRKMYRKRGKLAIKNLAVSIVSIEVID